MKIRTIIVTYNGSKWIKKCLQSVIDSRIKSDIIVIDNNSSDNTTTIIKEQFKNVTLVETGQNLGFGKANNIGIRKAVAMDSDYVLLLNQDAWVKIDTIEKLLNVSEKYRDYAILSPMQFFNKKVLDSKFENYYRSGKDIREDIRDVSFVNAAIWLIRVEDIKTLGVFNECFQHYGEDVEFCRRYMASKKKIGVVKSAIGYHERPQKKDKNFSLDIIKRNSEIRSLLGLLRMEYEPLKGLYYIFKFIFFGTRFINRKVQFGINRRLIVFFSTIPLYLSKRKKHQIT